MDRYILLVFFWIAYFAIHSLFASNFIKNQFKRYWSGLFNYYRFIYIIFAVLGIAIILFFQLSLKSANLFQTNILTTFLSIALASFGIMVIIDAFRYYDTKEFLGLKQISGNIGEQNFHRNGILNYVRHPIYSGTILLLLGYFLFSPSLLNMVTVCCMLLYILIGLRLEERKLIKAFGADYIKYLKEVPGLIPWRKRKL